MHSFLTDKFAFHHNGGFDGDVIIMKRDDDSYEAIEIPFEDIKAFVAQYVRMKKIGQIEQMNTDELLLEDK